MGKDEVQHLIKLQKRHFVGEMKGQFKLYRVRKIHCSSAPAWDTSEVIFNVQLCRQYLHLHKSHIHPPYQTYNKITIKTRVI